MLNPEKFKSLILGSGAAGLLAAISLKRGFPASEVKVIRRGEIGITRAGESTTPAFSRFLHKGLGLSPQQFLQRVRPTLKLGTRFLWGSRKEFHYAFSPQLDCQWPDLPRPNGYYCRDEFEDLNLQSALMSRRKAFSIDVEGLMRTDAVALAYHFESARLVEFLESHATGLGIELIEDALDRASVDGGAIEHIDLKSGMRMSADLYVDASGFASELIGNALTEPFIDYSDALLCDRVLVASSEYEPDDVIEPFTTAETFDSGWCWRIDHDDHSNLGYVYCSHFISDEDAEAEFRRKNPGIGESFLVHFRTGRRRRLWVENVVAVGNAAGFVEPLEATSLMLAAVQCRMMVQNLADSGLAMTDSMRLLHNRFMSDNWDDTRSFLALHYRFNNRLDTPFWKHCRANVPLHGVTELVDFYRVHGPSRLPRGILIRENNLFGLEGYLALLVGMGVPYEQAYEPANEEWRRWQTHKRRIADMAERAASVREALAAMRNPHSDRRSAVVAD